MSSGSRARLLLSLSLMICTGSSALAQPPAPNTQAEPEQILQTHTDLHATSLSANARQLAEMLNVLPKLQRMQELKARISQNREVTLERLALRQDLLDLRQETMEILDRTSKEIDYTLAEITDEQILYDEIQDTMTDKRDRSVARINALSFYTNGILWAVCEGLSIPTYKYGNFAISSGTMGILAGIVPSVASLWAMRRFNVNPSHERRQRPNMLAKVFDYPTSERIEYPDSVWSFLQSTPAEGVINRSRKDQIIDRWISDKNIPGFTDRSSKLQIDKVTGCSGEHVTIEVLSARQAMLQQLSSEIFKMNRLLLELMMVLTSEKQV